MTKYGEEACEAMHSHMKLREYVEQVRRRNEARNRAEPRSAEVRRGLLRELQAQGFRERFKRKAADVATVQQLEDIFNR